MRFKIRRLVKKLNIGLYIVLFIIIAIMFWDFTSSRDVNVKQISSADMGNNKVEHLLTKGNNKSEKTSEKETEESKKDELEDLDDLDDIDEIDETEEIKSEDLSDGEEIGDEVSSKEATAGDSFAIVLDSADNFVNLREEASSDSKIVARIYSGCGGTVVTPGEEWTEVASGEYKGYVKTELCIFGIAADKKLNEGGYTATITEDGIRVRAEKSTDAQVLGMAGVGSKYTCSEKDTGDGWVEITFEGQTGYVSSQFVTVDENVKTAVVE